MSHLLSISIGGMFGRGQREAEERREQGVISV
jgi:hypothetical protein